MKKLFFVLLLLASSFIGTSQADDALYRQCLDEKPYGTNSDWGACGGDYIKRVDTQLNAIWKIVLASYDGHPQADNIRKSLVAEQRAWIAYKENICDIFSSGYWGREGQVLGAPLCRGQLIEDRINELRRFYCFDDKCGFDKQQEPDFSDIKNLEATLHRLENPPARPTAPDGEPSIEDDAGLMQQYGIDVKKDAERDRIRFERFKNKACQFIEFLDATAENHSRKSACVSSIIEHRITQMNFDTYDSQIGYGRYANLGYLFQEDGWIFGCDQSFTCTAIGYQEAYDKGQYIRIRWQYNNNDAPDIRFVVASRDEKVQSGNFSYSLPDSKTNFPLIQEKVNAPVIMAAHIEPKNAEGFLQALLKDSQLTFGLQHEDMPVSHLNLKPFADFYEGQKQNVDKLYYQEQAQLPHFQVMTFKTTTLQRPKPQSEDDACLQSKSDDYTITITNGDAFAARCTDANPFAMSRNNRDAFQVLYSFQKEAKNGTPSAPFFDDKANWRNSNEWPQQTMLRDIYFDKNELHSIHRFGPGNDCGRDYGFAYDGTTWRLSSYRAMPHCALIVIEDWPMLYRSTLNEVKK